MRIAFLSEGLGNGGSERAASIIANELENRGHQILYIAAYSDTVTYELRKDIKYIYINTKKRSKLGRYWERRKKISACLKEYRPDYMIAFAYTIALPLIKNKSFKLICSERTNPSTKKFTDKIISQIVFRAAHKVVFQTTGAQSYFSRKIQAKSVIIYNALDDHLPRWNKTKHNRNIITACRISPEKNLEMLIKGFARFYRVHPEYCLEIYGEIVNEGEHNRLLQIIKDYHCENVVHFRGYSKDVRNIMAKSNCFVLTSNYEGLSNAMIEALAIGIPTICTDCPAGGAAMCIEDGVNGFLVGVNDDVGLAKRLKVLLEDSGLQMRFSDNSVKIRDKMQLDKVVDEWERLLI